MNKLQRIQELREMIKALKTEEDNLLAEVKLLGAGACHVQDGFMAIVTEKTRETLDGKALEALLGDLSDFKKKTRYLEVRIQRIDTIKIAG